MISLEQFFLAYKAFQRSRGGVGNVDAQQKEVIGEDPAKALFIVAGPGTGKTTCLTLRILKLIFVDDVPARRILATTFTKKAAAELRSRILGWGFGVIDTLNTDETLPASMRDRIRRVDINQVVTGTIDSICEQLLRDYRDPGTQPPIMADDFVSKTLLLREGLLESARYQDADLDRLLFGLHGGTAWGWNVGRKNDLIRGIWDRRFYDQLDWAAFLQGGPREGRRGRQVLGEALASYETALKQRMLVDFSLLEQEVLQRLQVGQLQDFVHGLRVLLVDEYQDTNVLQESIYFELAKACGGVITVVGDDDQSLYRFRGATVELFSEFASRYKRVFTRVPRTVFLKTNYRSTKTVVRLVNAYAMLDQGYQAVRVKAKPQLKYPDDTPGGTPVLGMFRDDLASLASDLAEFIRRLFRGQGYKLPDGTLLHHDSDGGDIGDCALLCSSPAEYGPPPAKQKVGPPKAPKERLPLLLRRELAKAKPPIEVFNPRGQDLAKVELVAQVGGLLLECLDPEERVESNLTRVSQNTIERFQVWRAATASLTGHKLLEDYVKAWGERKATRGREWPRSVPVLELVYALVHFFPALYDGSEGQVYLEVFTRQVSACEQVGKFKGRVVTDSSNPGLSDASVRELMADFLGPIASGAIGVNEELSEAFPRDRLSILSIHQAKGLEFPLTIVDVGSDFRTSHASQAFKRFPTKGGTSEAMEDILRPYSTLATPTRSGRDRAFDDLYRQFFVAFSRSQDVLLLVGLRATLPGGSVSNVAMGWTRQGVSAWQGKYPFVEI